jgi:glycosyltransferase involved in cell wall biosynthesis
LKKELVILGIRGVPASHGGFETFAECLSLYLVKRGWDVTVYCQVDPGQEPPINDTWEGINRIFVATSIRGAGGTVQFDWRSVIDAARRRSRLVLTLGYNTALFSLMLRVRGIRNVMNMDGIEWSRAKWGKAARVWLWMNERFGCWFADHLIADHPRIADHLASRVSRAKISTIAYGSREIATSDSERLARYSLFPKSYVLLIGRLEPENSILEIVEAFSRRSRGYKLVVLGNYTPECSDFHRKIHAAAGNEVVFLGAIYDQATVDALRHAAILYIHGHQVGGTNPSLVEALGAGNPVLAHDNQFNRWVAGEGSSYFSGVDDCAEKLDNLLADEQRLSEMSAASSARHRHAFRWPDILSAYEALLLSWLPGSVKLETATHESEVRLLEERVEP